MAETRADTETAAIFHRDQSSCKRCGEIIEMDVPACPHCRNHPAALSKWGCITMMLVGTILAASMAHSLMIYWPGSLIGVMLFCVGVSLYWVMTDRYSPTKHDAPTHIP